MARGQVRDARERGKRMSNVGRRRLVRVFMVGDSEDAGTMILRFSSLCRRRRPRPRFLAVDFSKLRSMSSWLPTCRVPHRHQVECMPREIRVTRETHETTISRPTRIALYQVTPRVTLLRKYTQSARFWLLFQPSLVAHGKARNPVLLSRSVVA